MKRRLCWAAGLCSVAVIVVLAVWHALSRWDSQESPWSRLPSKTQWAVRAHNLSSLLSTILGDPAAMAFLRGEARAVEIQTAVTLYRLFGFLHPAVAPNACVLGATARDPEAVFAIASTPVWLGYYARFRTKDPGGIMAYGEAGSRIYFALRDNWLVASRHEDAVREVLDGWDAGALPLGPDSGQNSPHVYFAARRWREEERAEPPASAALPPPAHFTFADPFAVGLPPPPVAPTEDMETPELRVLLLPGQAGWEFRGEAGRKTGFDRTVDIETAVRGTIGNTVAAMNHKTGQDLSFYAHFSAGARKTLLNALNAASPANQIVTRLLTWLREDWLDRSGNGWVFTANPPARDAVRLSYPPLPVFSLGWSLPDSVTADDANDSFADGLARLVDSIPIPDSSLPARLLRRTIAVVRDDDSGGRLALPDIAVNGARPAWRFDDNPPLGWLASDPTGLPDDSLNESVVLGSMPSPQENHITFMGGWTLSPEFLGATVKVMEDRQRLLEEMGLADNVFPGVDPAVFRTVTEALGCFPSGTLAGDIDCGQERIVFGGTFPRPE